MIVISPDGFRVISSHFWGCLNHILRAWVLWHRWICQWLNLWFSVLKLNNLAQLAGNGHSLQLLSSICWGLFKIILHGFMINCLKIRWNQLSWFIVYLVLSDQLVSSSSLLSLFNWCSISTRSPFGPFAGSWAVLSLGLLIFPENCQGIDRILTLRYVQELAPLAPGEPGDAAEMARSYAMNFAVRCFERLAFDESLCGHVKTPVIVTVSSWLAG